MTNPIKILTTIIYIKDTKTGVYVPLRAHSIQDTYKWTYEDLTQNGAEYILNDTKKSDFEDKVYYLVYSSNGKKSLLSAPIELPKELTSVEKPSGNYSYKNPAPLGTSQSLQVKVKLQDVTYTADLEIKFTQVISREEAAKFISERNLKYKPSDSDNELLVAYVTYKYTNIKSDDPSKTNVSWYDLKPYEITVSDEDNGVGKFDGKFEGGLDYSPNAGMLEVGKEYELKGYLVYEGRKNFKHNQTGFRGDKVIGKSPESDE